MMRRIESSESVKALIEQTLSRILKGIQNGDIQKVIDETSWSFSPAGDGYGTEVTYLAFPDYETDLGDEASLLDMLKYLIELEKSCGRKPFYAGEWPRER